MFLTSYINYLKDNPQGYWFKRRLYGWGWVPVRREGWLVIVLYLVALIAAAVELGDWPSEADIGWFYVRLMLATGLLLFICFKKGEKPRWQWGGKGKM